MTDELSLDADGELTFPCRFPVKAMTHTREQALDQVLAALATLDVGVDHETVTIRPSRNGRFQSITIEVDVDSRPTLEAVYARLRELEIVVMTL
jgi:putative lipoic acid-binding regulatory protein